MLANLTALTLVGACAQPATPHEPDVSEPGGATTPPPSEATPLPTPTLHEFPIPQGSGPHDVAVAPDGVVWYAAQRSGELGRLDPKTGEVKRIPLGPGSAPHGVIVGPDWAPWITDGGLNAIVRVDPVTEAVVRFLLPIQERANLNTATFDGHGILWFTGQAGYYGRVDPKDGRVQVFEAPRGRGPYGIATAPDGFVYYASLAGHHIAKIDLETGASTPIDPPTAGQGSRRIWADSKGTWWVSQFNAGQLARYDPATGAWKEWRLPGARPQPYAIYVDYDDVVWLSDIGANTMVRFDPRTERFESFEIPTPGASVRQILGRPGEVWAGEIATDKLLLIRTR